MTKCIRKGKMVVQQRQRKQLPVVENSSLLTALCMAMSMIFYVEFPMLLIQVYFQ